jgi:hypothetical protein
MRILLSILVTAALAVAADVDVTGKWAGTFHMTGPNGETSDSTAVLVLKQTGTEITGTVGPSAEDQNPIQKGKIEGNKLTLDAEHHGRLIKFDLVVAADRIAGDASMSADGQTAKAKLDVTRTK